MSFIRTVLGDIAPSELGLCYAHEHIIIDASFTTQATPDFLLDDVAKASAELSDFRAAGGSTMVDSMPCDCGRNVRKLAEISRASGVHIVAPTGLHMAKYYDPGHWGHFYAEDQLAALFIAEIKEGIDAHDYSGPIVERAPHRAGVIKIATDAQWSPREEKLFAAAAHAHRRTGCPILTHTEQGTLGLEQAERLHSLGVDLRHVVLSHTDRKPDRAYHRDLLQTGVRLEYDSGFRWKEGNPTLDLVVELAPEFPRQILLGMDAARRSYWTHHGGRPGLCFLLREFRGDLLARGLKEALWQQIMRDNPARAYAFAVR
ncbi:MAG: aryldialkylphosphatase [Verrucomicrobia bacterium 61-8]|nr:aryldialkylphosphatase [Verrucomicrobiota bacterium]OJV01278.1 MAG: aryldialkylphosphatase [Verrucomicrobia bacterium 61-8]